MMIRILKLLFLPLMALGIIGAVPPLRAEDKPILVFAAVSLKDALEPIAAEYERETGQKMTLAFAGTSTLARQIAAGAPADLFISADLDWVAWLKVQNLTMPETQRIIAYNQLALVAPNDSPYSQAQDIAEILKDWQANSGARIAVSDPEHVPAGRYARSALKALASEIGPYEALEPRLVIAGNVRLASLLVARGEVPLGIVYHSDAVIEPRIKLVGIFPPESHADIVYPALRTLNGRKQADSFITYLGSETARKYLHKAGFSLPTRGL